MQCEKKKTFWDDHFFCGYTLIYSNIDQKIRMEYIPWCLLPIEIIDQTKKTTTTTNDKHMIITIEFNFGVKNKYTINW